MLISERDKLNTAIAALQGSDGPTMKRRGRPPKNAVRVSTETTAAKPARKKRTFTTAQRKAQAKRMKDYWAARRKTVKKAA